MTNAFGPINEYFRDAVYEKHTLLGSSPDEVLAGDIMLIGNGLRAADFSPALRALMQDIYAILKYKARITQQVQQLKDNAEHDGLPSIGSTSPECDGSEF